MKFQIGFILFLALLATFTSATVNYSDYENNMVFFTWNAQGATMNFTFDNNDTFLQMCPPPSNWTIVSHAWREDITSEEWTKSVVDSFIAFRGGCVMFMDYK